MKKAWKVEWQYSDCKHCYQGIKAHVTGRMAGQWFHWSTGLKSCHARYTEAEPKSEAV